MPLQDQPSSVPHLCSSSSPLAARRAGSLRAVGSRARHFSISQHERSSSVDDGSGSSAVESPFTRAQDQVLGLVLRLEKALRAAGDGRGSTDDRPAREALLAKSRQFVTASKVFVRSASENAAGAPVTAQLATCLSLLDGMCAAAEQLAAASPALVEQVIAVAVAYARATGAAGGAAVGPLMHQATDLASALTALMRTLRAPEGS